MDHLALEPIIRAMTIHCSPSLRSSKGAVLNKAAAARLVLVGKWVIQVAMKKMEVSRMLELAGLSQSRATAGRCSSPFRTHSSHC